MDLMKQILILALCLVPAWTCMHRCCNQDELNKAAQKKLQRRFQPPPEPLPDSRIDASCPLDLYLGRFADKKDRSLSPWRYVQVTNEDLFPPTYIKAECLCLGCIVEKKDKLVENFDYDSVTVEQSRIFLKREQGDCKKGMYQLSSFEMKIPVACTCIRPNYSLA